MIGDIFNINTPKKKFDANKITFGGDYPYVARGDKNNGIRGYTNEDTKYLNNGSTISFGQDTATMFYQENAYFTGDKIKVFSLKNGKLNKLNSQFLISAMKKSFGLFSWGSSSFSEGSLKQSKIQLPIINSELAFDYMENYMRELQKERLRELQKERLRELQKERLRELQKERLRELQKERLRELQKERLRELQKERLRELQLYLDITGFSSYELTDDELKALGG
ncbi:restriction endonuclease subunit S [Moraxella sp. Tifton1]|nr:restriction endonuclease subunit S [Moraxella sp. Tifton1]